MTEVKKPNEMFVPAGKKLVGEFERVWDEKRKCQVVRKTGTYDIDEFIQSCSNVTDMAMLKDRCVKLGEIPSVNPNIQFGVDEVMFPNDIHDLNDIIANAKSTFEGFPEDVRNAFGNNYETYLNSVINGSSSTLLQQYANKKAEEEAKAKEGGNE